jgi:hypothetical protein
MGFPGNGGGLDTESYASGDEGDGGGELVELVVGLEEYFQLVAAGSAGFFNEFDAGITEGEAGFGIGVGSIVWSDIIVEP